ncbi:MAG: LPS export ABC transporter periplasmic protein LptC [Bacteroidaceae bacterium]|nr:LPS export ABC transporter periplasmic protein LptC [Bacteroidaceae bacterium]
MKRKTILFVLCLFTFSLSQLLICACTGEVEHIAEPVDKKDSLLFVHSKGINTFISDSGVMRYHMVVEEWDIYNGVGGEPATWKFMKGLLMERFDEKFHVDLFVQSDTAYLHRQQLWELRGRVVVRNVNGDVFHTEELFWNLDTHEMWNHQYIYITTPERELEGTEFRSNEQMTCYSVLNSIGTFPVKETETPAPQATPDDQSGSQPPKKEAETTVNTEQ